MLKQRVLTAIPLAALVIWGILSQPETIIFNALLVVVAISAWEWTKLSGVKNALLRTAYAVSLTVVTYFSQQILLDNQQWVNSFFLIIVLAWLVVIYQMFAKGPQPVNQNVSIVKLCIGIVVLISPILALMLIHSESAEWLFYCLSLVWVADIGAYFSGKRFGKNKLAPSLSPGKTKEGMYGAVFATAIYSLIAGVFFELQLIEMFLLLIITALATFISVAGDLFISLLKREKDLKDTGNILPGHGGILDRIDSVLTSAPLLALLLNLVIFDA